MMKRKMNFMFLTTFLAIGLALLSCKKDDDSSTSTTTGINPGNDPNFKIEANRDGAPANYPKKVTVFGIDIYAVSQVEDTKLLHAANIMAQYLDNDEDGTVDNQDVMDAMLGNKAYMVMWKTENDLETGFIEGRTGQDLGNDETHPSFVSGGKTGEFDASLEEVWHIITHAGYSQAYPNAFGELAGSELADAMDIARGGNFTSIPNPYPNGAWYTYDDETCDYECQSTEYFYWAMTSILGAQENRSQEIGHEWKLHTSALVEQTDTKVYELLTNPVYKLPTKLPDGTYRH